ncbi:hypothetical protein [Streptomyces sp. RKAG293]|uniref:hypothetical protein n=1 Tax=Streptomyces sp. RKAG293 TaxID=2893403 RepID=UPI0035A8B0F6
MAFILSGPDTRELPTEIGNVLPWPARASRPLLDGKLWTGTGATHDDRGSKNRPVPIPPQLVDIYRAHPETFGAAKDGRLFANRRGGVAGASTCCR